MCSRPLKESRIVSQARDQKNLGTTRSRTKSARVRTYSRCMPTHLRLVASKRAKLRSQTCACKLLFIQAFGVTRSCVSGTRAPLTTESSGPMNLNISVKTFLQTDTTLKTPLAIQCQLAGLQIPLKLKKNISTRSRSMDALSPG